MRRHRARPDALSLPAPSRPTGRGAHRETTAGDGCISDVIAPCVRLLDIETGVDLPENITETQLSTMPQFWQVRNLIKIWQL